jgi:hypothetical protein
LRADCTPKAVSHRLNNIRNHGKPLPNSNSAGTTPVKVATTPKTPRSRAKATPKKAAPVDSESDSGGPEGLLESPSARRSSNKRPRSAPGYAEADGSDEVEEEYVPFSKRVKVEPVEEEFQLGKGELHSVEGEM